MNLSQQLRLGLKLTPQQVQYLKLLQLPNLVLEQRIKTELELNPMLELQDDVEQTVEQEEPTNEVEEPAESKAEDTYTLDDYMHDESAGYKSADSRGQKNDEDDNYEPTITDVIPLSERLLSQFRLLTVDEVDCLLAEEILGNVEQDGYLRRELALIVQDLNLTHNLDISLEKAELVLKKIQNLDPVGIGSRSLQECMIVQLEASKCDPALKALALRIMREMYDDFTMRHFEEISKKMNISLDELKKVIWLIQHLNPKPGEGDFTAQENYIVPDFIVTQSDDDFIITLNDRNIPPLRINKAYKELMSKRKKNGVSNEAKDFIRQRFEAAKWFISSIHQRRETMMKVMRSIVDKQREFFETGEGLRPMIYKDISEVIGMDISTISRVVNSKFVQTDYGVFSLRHFFSDSISTTDGDEVSNKEVKRKLKDLIDAEDPLKPYSDDKLAQLLNDQGLNIARRTVAKYREAMLIPVARLRRKLT